MKIVFAPGNPGPRYGRTRHNIGWRCLDGIAARYQGVFSPKPKFLAAIAELTIDSEKVLLVKPTTFYNEVGQSLRLILDFYKLSTSDVLAIHDDLAINFGTIRVRHAGSPAGNNGIKSINAHVGEHYARIRIGIHNDTRSHMNDADFVLAKFSHMENEIIESHIIAKVYTLTEKHLRGELEDESFRLLDDASTL